MSDSILDDVKAAAEELANGADPGAGAGEAPERQPAVDAAGDRADEQPSQDGRERDENGRFKAKQPGDKRETLTLKDKPAEAPAEPVAEQPAAPQEQQQAAKPEPILPPGEWKGAAKVRWDRLPREVQAEISERYNAFEQQRAALEPVSRAIEPHRELWMRDAGSVEAAIGQLGQFYRLYLDNPQGLIQHIARTRGIDLGAFVQQPDQPGAPQQAPDLNSIVAQTVQQALQPILAERQQAETQQIQQQIDAFRRDPKHPYFEDVKVHMGHLIRIGSAKDMQEAYDQAVWANPAIRQQLLESQAEEARKTQAAAADKARKAAAASVRGSPLPGVAVNGAGNPNASVHDDVRAAFAEHGLG